MNRADRWRWSGARSLGDLGELTARWCEGAITETPGHAGPPCTETVPYLNLLAAVNRAGFVTENSQAAGPTWTAWVCGFADARTAGLLATVAGHYRLIVRGMPWAHRREIRYWYRRSCPAARRAIRGARLVWIEDPVPGCNTLLWPVLAEFTNRGHGG